RARRQGVPVRQRDVVRLRDPGEGPERRRRRGPGRRALDGGVGPPAAGPRDPERLLLVPLRRRLRRPGRRGRPGDQLHGQRRRARRAGSESAGRRRGAERREPGGPPSRGGGAPPLRRNRYVTLKFFETTTPVSGSLAMITPVPVAAPAGIVMLVENEPAASAG